MPKRKSQNHIKQIMLDALAEFYQGVIKLEMASKKDLERFATREELFATKEELKQDLKATESRLGGEIRKNNQLINNIEISLSDTLKNHERRIKYLEKLHPLSPA